MNPNSSRSHVILQLDLEIKSGMRFERLTTTSLTLADLAGSECLDKTKTKGKNTREGGMINKSLLALSTVISKLSKKGEYIGFRESKLTRLLQPALTGNSLVSVICTVSPQRANLQESINTLKFGTCAGVIKKKIEYQPQDDRLAKEVIQDLHEKALQLEELHETLFEKDQANEMLRLQVEELQAKVGLAENEKGYYIKEVERLTEELRRSLADHKEVLAMMEDLEYKVEMKKEAEFRNMFEQQSLFIKNLEEENEKLKKDCEMFKDVGSHREVMPCMRRTRDGSAQERQGDFASSSHDCLEDFNQAPSKNKELLDKLIADLNLYKTKFNNCQKDVIKQEKIMHQLRLDNEALKKELAEIGQYNHRPRKIVKSVYSKDVFDRDGNLIESKVRTGLSYDELSKQNKMLEKRTKKMEREREASASLTQQCKVY